MKWKPKLGCHRRLSTLCLSYIVYHFCCLSLRNLSANRNSKFSTAGCCIKSTSLGNACILAKHKDGLFKDAAADVGLTQADVDAAMARLQRFAPYIQKVFPETQASNGIIESEFYRTERLRKVLGIEKGALYIKADNELPISGSIKARGGIYEVLQYAEKLALDHGLLSIEDDYSKLDSKPFRDFFSKYSVAVGSTGNLGLSIGIMSAKLGFKAQVHMSSDAKQWKKDKLRANGVEVFEYDGDYGQAVASGRQQVEQDPYGYFVDDENSKHLFLGYAVAGIRLKQQFDKAGITIDKQHPLYVYLPCGVGGGGRCGIWVKTCFWRPCSLCLC